MHAIIKERASGLSTNANCLETLVRVGSQHGRKFPTTRSPQTRYWIFRARDDTGSQVSARRITDITHQTSLGATDVKRFPIPSPPPMSTSAKNIRLLLVRSDPRFEEGVARGLADAEPADLRPWRSSRRVRGSPGCPAQ